MSHFPRLSSDRHDDDDHAPRRGGDHAIECSGRRDHEAPKSPQHIPERQTDTAHERRQPPHHRRDRASDHGPRSLPDCNKRRQRYSDDLGQDAECWVNVRCERCIRDRGRRVGPTLSVDAER